MSSLFRVKYFAELSLFLFEQLFTFATLEEDFSKGGHGITSISLLKFYILGLEA
jgi:hypothetical protein